MFGQESPNADFVNHMLRVLKEADIAELEITEGDVSLRLVSFAKTDRKGPYDPGHTAPANTVVNTITAPLAGTLFVAQSPTDAPFVLEGDAFEEGQTLFIVEAMKSLTSVPAPAAGRVLRRLVEDGVPIDADTPVFEVEWDAVDA